MEDIGKFEPPSAAELAWLGEKRAHLSSYLEAVLSMPAVPKVSSDLLDELWVAWRAISTGDDEAVLNFVEVFGVGFGDLLVHELGFEWSILTDEYGTDLAVRALPGTGDIRVTPIDFVLKRYQDEQLEPYVAHAIVEIGQVLERQKKEWSDSGAA